LSTDECSSDLRIMHTWTYSGEPCLSYIHSYLRSYTRIMHTWTYSGEPFRPVRWLRTATPKWCPADTLPMHAHMYTYVVPLSLYNIYIYIYSKKGLYPDALKIWFPCICICMYVCTCVCTSYARTLAEWCLGNLRTCIHHTCMCV
jgi:hypothetical protein